jgi:CBS domain containing-hemolysin-like protein
MIIIIKVELKPKRACRNRNERIFLGGSYFYLSLHPATYQSWWLVVIMAAWHDELFIVKDNDDLTHFVSNSLS